LQLIKLSDRGYPSFAAIVKPADAHRHASLVCGSPASLPATYSPLARVRGTRLDSHERGSLSSPRVSSRIF